MKEAVFDDVVQLWYYDKDNLFVDSDGFPVFSIFTLITPNDLFLFQHHKEYMLVSCCTNPRVGVELIYPEDDECEHDSVSDYTC